MTRFAFGALAAICLTVAATSAQAEPAAAKAYVDSVTQQVLAISKSDMDKSAKTSKLEALFSDKVDMDFIARFVLGKHWRAATPAQQSAYIAAYKPFLLKNYAGRLAKYSGQTYSLKNARAEDGGVDIVTMQINDTNGQSFLVDYRIRNNKILDIIVEGVSLLATQRSEFSAIVDDKGIDGLTEALKSKVARQAD